MKKLLITIPFLFLAAACNKQQAQVQPVQNSPVQITQTTQQTQVQPETQQPLVTSTDETVNWKIYNDSTCNLSLKYPQGWKLLADTLNSDGRDIHINSNDSSGTIMEIQCQPLAFIGYASFASFISSLRNSTKFDTAVISSSTGMFTYTNTTLNGPGGMFDNYYAAGKNNYLVHVLVWNQDKNSEIVNQILSSFVNQ